MVRVRATAVVLLAALAGPVWGAPPALDGAAAQPVDLLALVLAAHWVVQAVMGVLALAAFAVLTVFLHKLFELAWARRQLRRAQALLARHPDLPLPGQGPFGDGAGGAAGQIVQIVAQELAAAAAQPALRRGCADRSRMALSRLELGAMRRLRVGLGLLASVAAVAPFVGLFGTVFGIMNSFLAISAAQTTNLSVVAPGIAEALFATAIGLVAAIPAVLVHNWCLRGLAQYRGLWGDVQAMALMAQSRALDRMAGDDDGL